MSKHYPLIVDVKVSAKKGDVQNARFGIIQSVPHPDATTTQGSLTWRNLETLDPNTYCNHAGPHLPPIYRVVLLRNDTEEYVDNRTDYAGFKEHPAYNKPQTPPNPGTLVFRGEDMGEITGTIRLKGSSYPEGLSFQTSANSSAEKWLHQQVSDKLIEAVKARQQPLRDHAFARLAERFAQCVEEMRQGVEKLDREARAILDKALSNSP
jgi:hypothetical protein